MHIECFCDECAVQNLEQAGEYRRRSPAGTMNQKSATVKEKRAAPQSPSTAAILALPYAS